jgi:hypothetical protein
MVLDKLFYRGIYLDKRYKRIEGEGLWILKEPHDEWVTVKKQAKKEMAVGIWLRVIPD